MSNHFKILLIVCTFLILNFTSKADIRAKITISSSVSSYKIPNHFTGIFVELTGDCVNGYAGIWAQELMDRGFDFSIDYGNESFKTWHVWTTNAKDPTNKHIQFLPGGINTNGKNFLRLTGDKDKNEYRCYQKVYLCDSVNNMLSLYTRGCNRIDSGSIVIFNPDMTKKLFEYKFYISDSIWQKTEFVIPHITGFPNGLLSICYKGSDYLDIDEISMVPENNQNGLRKEYYDFIDKLKPNMFRYPGGGFADAKVNKLENAIGSIDMRVSPNLLWNGFYQRMDLGLHEFVKICKTQDMEPLIVINFENGTAQEAADYIEYCNGDTNTKFGALRAKNGNVEPFNIKYWEVGNEQWWDLTPKYIRYYKDFYNAMKSVDSSIFIIADGNIWDWDSFDKIIDSIGNNCQLYSFHSANFYKPNNYGTDIEKYLSYLSYSYDNDFSRFEKEISTKCPNVKLCDTEWWTNFSPIPTDTAYIANSLGIALWTATHFFEYLKHSKSIDFTIRTFCKGFLDFGQNKNGERVIYGGANFYALSIINRHLGDIFYPVITDVGTFYNYSNTYNWTYETPWLEAIVTGTKDSLFLIVVNRHPNEQILTDIDLKLNISSDTANIYTLWSPNFLDANSLDEPIKIRDVQSKWVIQNQYSFLPHSITVIAYNIKQNPFVIDSILYENGNSIYTNPTKKNFPATTFTEILNKYKLEIYDLLGNLVFTGESSIFNYNNYKIDNINVSPGVYLILISNGQEKFSKTIIKY